ncbi:MAG: diguanylate cyclase, partial [Oscillospiraceae bacterium]|nr:diguanylate cyclase [Oscillospiraceae bacterium]
LQGGGHVSYFLPLHFRDRCLGYFVITDSLFPVRSMVCHSLMMNISNSIENIRKLLHLNNVISELDRLYVIDPLCGIYNRNGFIREADIIFRRCEASGDPVMIGFIDMDGLKMINDNYGHKEGDFALQRLASAI